MTLSQKRKLINILGLHNTISRIIKKVEIEINRRMMSMPNHSIINIISPEHDVGKDFVRTFDSASPSKRIGDLSSKRKP